MFILMIILSAISAASLSYYLKELADTRLAGARLCLNGAPKLPGSVIFNRFAMPINYLSRWFKGLRMMKFRQWLSQRFIYAGINEKITCDQFFAFSLFTGLLFIIFSSGIFSGAVLFVLGASYPVFWLDQVIRKRRIEMIRSMPYVVDLLTLSVEAGLDFMAAICRVTEGSKSGALIDELKNMLDEIKVGVSRSDALRHLSKRCNAQAITSLTALLVQADRLGASIGPVLRAQSDKLRSERFQRAERAGAAAAQKMLFPLVFFMIPAVFIVIFGPIFIRFASGGFNVANF